MKRHKHLFESVCSLENLHLAYLKARRGKQKRQAIEAFTFYLESELLKLRDGLLNGTYTPGAYRQFTVYESKKRLISAAPFRDRVVHHAVCNIIEPIFEPTFIYDSYACRVGKGQHTALQRLRKFLRKNRYVLRGDITRYFPSIDHEILLNLLARKIGDKRLLDLLAKIIAHSPPEVGEPVWFEGDNLFAPLHPHGLPIGNQTSQFFANVYLNPFDYFVKENLREKYYLRYVDDFVILSNDKAHLHAVKNTAKAFLAELRLQLHKNKTQVFPATDGIDWLGYRVFPNHVRIRKSNVHRFKRRMRRMQEAYQKGEVSIEEVGIRIQSWLAARGTTIQTICGLPVVTITIPITGTTISVFVVRPRVFPVPEGLMFGVHGRFARTPGNKENRATPGWFIQPNDVFDRRRLVGVDRKLSPIPLNERSPSMKTGEQISVKCWYLIILVLLVMVSASDDLTAQDASVETEAKSSPTVESSPPQKQINLMDKLKKPIEDWIKNHPLAALFWSIITPIVSVIATWIFKDIIKKIVVEELRPLFKRIFTGVLIRSGRYNRALKIYHESLQMKLQEVGLTQQLLGEGVDMEKNYIPIELSKEEYKNPETEHSFDSQPKKRTLSRTEEANRERVEVRYVLDDEENYGSRIAIIGDPGAGKTTLMQYLSYQCTKRQGCKLIPVLIILTTYVGSKVKGFRLYLETLFADSGFPKAQEYIERQLKSGEFLFLFDGFDEVEINARNEIRRQIEDFSNNAAYLQNKFVVTSRPIRDAVFDNFRHLEVMPLTPEQRRGFLESKVDNSPNSEFNSQKCTELVEAIESNDRIQTLAENPLLLTFLYHVYKYNLRIPRYRVELYRLSIDLMLGWDIDTKRLTHIKVKDRDAKKEVLKKVAYYYHTDETRYLPEAELFVEVNKHLPDSLKEVFTPQEFVREIENSSGILRHRTAESYQFIHLTFQEYLTADYINDNRDAEIPKLMKVLHDSWWREVTLLLAGIMGNATPLVSSILNYRQERSGESEKSSCTFIAVSCLSQAEVDDDIRNEVIEALTTIPYNQAFDFIENTFDENEKVETFLLDILNNPHEAVQAWGISFLNEYPQVAEESERLIEKKRLVWQRLAAIHNAENQEEIDKYLRSLAPEGMALIPAGEFQMGSSDGKDDEKPVHTVYLDAFYIDVNPMTNTQYRKFIEATGHPEPKYWDDERFNQPNQPVVGVTWYDAMAYAEWAGKRLPTEAEWEKAASGGLVGKRFPWGDDEPDKIKANYGNNVGKTTSVGNYPENGYGLNDMSGNVWEWCLDEYKKDFYQNSPKENPLAGENPSDLLTNYKNIETRRVLRGGSWLVDPYYLRVACRDDFYPVNRSGTVGFRCSSPRFPCR